MFDGQMGIFSSKTVAQGVCGVGVCGGGGALLEPEYTFIPLIAQMTFFLYPLEIIKPAVSKTKKSETTSNGQNTLCFLFFISIYEDIVDILQKIHTFLCGF